MFTDPNKKALIELAKSLGRFLWFGFLGLVITALGMVLTSNAFDGVTLTMLGMTLSLKTLIFAVVSFIIKAIDKYIHENRSIKSNGIAPSFLQG